MRQQIFYPIVFLPLLLLIMSACQYNEEVQKEELTIFAASSLRETFNDLKLAFESEAPDTDIQINYAATSTLRSQIEHGAKADLFASANHEQIEKLSASGYTSSDPVAFAQNDLVLIASQKTPNIETFTDILTPGLKIVTALPEVPIGEYTLIAIREIESSGYYGKEFPANFTRNIVSRETNVRSMLSRVVLGEVDAAIVYSTDISKQLDSSVKRIPFPIELNTKPTYSIVTLEQRDKKKIAGEFISFLSSSKGSNILLANGFRAIKQDE
jgi:molybdate transport system substrate-binding protein